MTPDQLEKLPKWAQTEFKTLENENNRLRKAMADPEESPFYTETYTTSGSVRRYIQDERCLKVHHEGITLQILLPCGVQGRHGIELQWESLLHQNVGIYPRSHQMVTLMIPKDRK